MNGYFWYVLWHYQFWANSVVKSLIAVQYQKMIYDATFNVSICLSMPKGLQLCQSFLAFPFSMLISFVLSPLTLVILEICFPQFSGFSRYQRRSLLWINHLHCYCYLRDQAMSKSNSILEHSWWDSIMAMLWGLWCTPYIFWKKEFRPWGFQLCFRQLLLLLLR